MKKYKREYETKEQDTIETFFPIKKKTVYKKKGVIGWRGIKITTIKTESK